MGVPNSKQRKESTMVKKMFVIGMLTTACLWVSGCRDSCCHLPTTPTSTSCTYAVQETLQNFTYQGGDGGFSVTTQSNCSWTAMSNVSWVAITSGSAGTGNGSTTYTVAGNGGPTRTGTISAAGKTVTIAQTGR